MFEFVAAATACYGAQLAQQQVLRQEREALAAQDRWEEENLRPSMTEEAWQSHLAERTRLRERADDIRRQERQHQDRVAAEREKAAAIREAGRRRPSDLLLGFVAGELLGR